jgi:hypothetical protein
MKNDINIIVYRLDKVEGDINKLDDIVLVQNEKLIDIYKCLPDKNITNRNNQIFYIILASVLSFISAMVIGVIL